MDPLSVIAILALGGAFLSTARESDAAYGANPRRQDWFGADDDDETYGGVPHIGIGTGGGISGRATLKAAGLAPGGSWTRRNVLQAGAQSAWARRITGDATEADFAVLAAARPGIASGYSPPISGSWTGSPWRPGAGTVPGPGIDPDELGESISDQVLKDMGIA